MILHCTCSIEKKRKFEAFSVEIWTDSSIMPAVIHIFLVEPARPGVKGNCIGTSAKKEGDQIKECLRTRCDLIKYPK